MQLKSVKCTKKHGTLQPQRGNPPCWPDKTCFIFRPSQVWLIKMIKTVNPRTHPAVLALLLQCQRRCKGVQQVLLPYFQGSLVVLQMPIAQKMTTGLTGWSGGSRQLHPICLQCMSEVKQHKILSLNPHIIFWGYFYVKGMIRIKLILS